MSLEFKFLNDELLPEIFKCFQEAFADYPLDMSYMTEPVFLNQAIKNGVNLESSIGVFDGDKLVAFSIIGFDNWRDEQAAYNAGTGVIPSYRGQGILSRLYPFIFSQLKKKGIKRFIVEVLKDNATAVNDYTQIGFNITREFDCFELETKNFQPVLASKIDLIIRPVKKDMLQYFERHLEWKPSWENSFSSIKRIQDFVILYGAYSEEQCTGLLVYYPTLQWILNLVVERHFRREGIGSHLVSHCINSLPQSTTKIKAMNILHSDLSMIYLLNNLGFKKFAEQYEMEYLI